VAYFLGHPVYTVEASEALNVYYVLTGAWFSAPKSKVQMQQNGKGSFKKSI